MKEEITDQTIISEKKDSLHKLMDLAYDGIFAETGIKILFTNEDIKKYGLTSEELGSGIMGSYRLPTKATSGKRRLQHHSFPHLTLQEIKAASKQLKVRLFWFYSCI